MFERGHRYLLAVIGITLAGLCLRAPVLHTGFIVDDYAQLSMMNGSYPVQRAPLGLFTFTNGEATENQALVDAGFFPWWTHPELKISLFRPLASALMWLDRMSFGDDALLYHLHSAAWWFGMSITWAMLARSFIPAGWALLVHALCTLHPANGMLLGWIANRNASVAMLFGLLSLYLQVKRSEFPKPVGALIPVCWCLTLLAGEYGVSILVYSATYELCARASIREKWQRLWPCLAVLLAYGVLRSALQFGSRNSGMYIDPTGEPLAFLGMLVTRGPALLADLVMGFRANWWSGGNPWGEAVERAFQLKQGWSFDLRSMRNVHLALGLLSIPIAASIIRYSRRQNPQLSFAAWAFPLSLVPAVGGTPESRLLLPAMFGWSLLQAQAVMALLAQHRDRARILPTLSLIAVCGLVALQIKASFDYSMEDRAFLPQVAKAARRSILAPHMDALANVEDAFLIAAVDPTTTIYIPMLRRWHERPGPARCHLLLNAASWIRLERLSDNELRLTRDEHYYTPLDVYAETFRRAPLQVGQAHTTRSFRATVEQVLDGMPIVIRVTTQRSLDDPAVALLTQNRSGIRIHRFPAVGETMALPPPDFPFELMGE